MGYKGSGTESDPYICDDWDGLVTVVNTQNSVAGTYVEMDASAPNKIIDFNEINNGMPFTTTPLVSNVHHNIKWNGWILRNLVLNGVPFMSSRGQSGATEYTNPLTGATFENLIVCGNINHLIAVSGSLPGQMDKTITNFKMSLLDRSTDAMSGYKPFNNSGYTYSGYTFIECNVTIKVASPTAGHSQMLFFASSTVRFSIVNVVFSVYATAFDQNASASTSSKSAYLVNMSAEDSHIYVGIGKYCTIVKSNDSSKVLASGAYTMFVGGGNYARCVVFCSNYNSAIEGWLDSTYAHCFTDITLAVDTNNSLSKTVLVDSNLKWVDKDDINNADYISSTGFPII